MEKPQNHLLKTYIPDAANLPIPYVHTTKGHYFPLKLTLTFKICAYILFIIEFKYYLQSNQTFFSVYEILNKYCQSSRDDSLLRQAIRD